MTEHVRFTVRGFLDKAAVFEDYYIVPEVLAGHVIESLAPLHLPKLVTHKIDLLEVEFLDAPDDDQRFMRFALSPEGMKNPVALKMDKWD